MTLKSTFQALEVLLIRPSGRALLKCLRHKSTDKFQTRLIDKNVNLSAVPAVRLKKHLPALPQRPDTSTSLVLSTLRKVSPSLSTPTLNKNLLEKARRSASAWLTTRLEDLEDLMLVLLPAWKPPCEREEFAESSVRSLERVS